MSDKPCLHCAIMAAIDGFFQENGERQDGKPVIDIPLAISKLAECAVEIAEQAGDRPARRRAMRFAHDALDAALEAERTGKPVMVAIPGEH